MKMLLLWDSRHPNPLSLEKKTLPWIRDYIGQSMSKIMLMNPAEPNLPVLHEYIKVD